MRKIASLALLVLAVTSLASATSTIQFITTGGNSYNGVASYPYLGTLDGVPTTFMCLDDFRFISYGESWAVNGVHPQSLVEMEQAWLFLRAGNGSNSDYQGAIWWLTDNSETLTPGAQSLLNTVAGQNLNPSMFTGVTIWQPDVNNQTGWTNGQPQDFMSTPEPTSLLALGTGVLGIAVRLRRKV
jgi:hypothetical protein